MPRAPRPAVWGIGFAALYLLTGARTPQWADASKLTLYALHGYFPSLNPGDHPGWTVVAWLCLQVLPQDPVVACHRLSAVAGALSVAFLVKLLALLQKPPQVVRGTAIVWGAAHSLWWAAASTETYALASALAIASLVVGQKKGEFLAGVLAGWAAATHALTLLLTAPALGYRHGLGKRLGGFFLGASPVWLGLFLTPGKDPLTGHTSAGLPSLAWHVESFLLPSRFFLGLLFLIALVLWNLGPLGLWAWWKETPGTRGTLWPLAILAVFLAAYAPFRLHLMAGFLVLGLLLWRPPSLTTAGACLQLLVQTALYLSVPWALTRWNLAGLYLRPLPYRNNAVYFLNPMKATERSAHHYALELFSTAPPNAVILADFNPGAVLKLVQETRKLRPDMTVVPTVVDDCVRGARPAECLSQHVKQVLDEGRPVLLADTYEPYYRLSELARLGFAVSLQKTGRPAKVERHWRADRDSNPEPSDP